MFKLKCLIAMMTVVMMCGSLSAQEFGRGRLLKRIRDEIARANKKDSERRNEAERKKNSAKDARSSNVRSAKNRNPNPANRNGRSTNAPNSERQPFSRTSGRPRAPARPTPSGKSGNLRKGFGMSIIVRKEKVVVAKVDSKGNAREAGIRPGDIIKEVGGLEIETIDDFNEFTKILGPGDQMEFKVNSRGKDKEVLIVFGEVDEAAELDLGPAPETTSRSSFVPASDNGFVAPGRSDGGQVRSVMDGRSTSGRAASDIARGDSRVQSLQRTVDSQRREIESLRRELVRLRQQVLINRENDRTSLNGPGK